MVDWDGLAIIVLVTTTEAQATTGSTAKHRRDLSMTGRVPSMTQTLPQAAQGTGMTPHAASRSPMSVRMASTAASTVRYGPDSASSPASSL